MIKYMLLTSIVLAGCLLNGCLPDLGFPDLETQMRNRERAKVSVDIKRTRLRVAEAKKDEDIKKIRRLSELKLNRINNKIELEEVKHRSALRAAETESNLLRLANEANIYLSQKVRIPSANYRAADSLLKKLPVKLAKDSPILVASFVNIDDLDDSSTFGRVISEQFASRFNQKGYATIELKLRTTVFIKEGSGEFLLSRELEEISIKHRAQAVVVGTYAVASKKIYLTARVVNVSDGRVLSSYDYSIPISRDVFKMLLKGKSDSGWL